MLRQILQVLILPNSFRSIDFTRKGAYCLTFKLIHKQQSKPPTIGYPFRLSSPQTSLSFQPQIDYQSGTYQTQMFFISFNSQKFQFLTDGCLFRIETPWINNTPLELEIRLLHLDVESLEKSEVKKSGFKEKAIRVLKIESCRDFYGDVIFGEFDYFCALELTVQMAVIDYRLRLKEEQLLEYVQNNKDKQEVKQNEIKGSNGESKIKQKSKIKQSNIKNDKTKRKELPFKCSSLEQKQQFLVQCLGNQLLTTFYRKLITKQILNYQKLYKKLLKLLSFLNQSDLLNFWRQYKVRLVLLRSSLEIQVISKLKNLF